MRKIHWLAASLSLTLGVSTLAGCGHTPTQAPTGAGQAAAAATDYNGPLAAQVANASTTVPTGASEPASPMPPASSTAPASPTTPVATPGAPGAPGTPGAPGQPGQPGQPGVPGVPGAPGAPGATGPIGGSGLIGGIGGGIPNVIGTGGAPFVFGANPLIAFQSNRGTSGNGVCNMDIYVYDAAAQTVLALPGVNTFANEVNPNLSVDGRWLVYQTDVNGNEDIYLFDMATQLINALPTLNTPADEMEPAVSDNGALIAYISDISGCDQLRLFDLRNGNDFIVPVANKGLTHLTWPSISGDGTVIAYGASALDWSHHCDTNCNGFGSDIFLYSIPLAAQITPPFLNTNCDEYEPSLNIDGSQILYVSNRRGTPDIYMTDMRTGFTDNLVLANSPWVEDQPRWLGPSGTQFVFQSNRTGNWRIYAYDMATALLDTLPVANDPIADSQLADNFPQFFGFFGQHGYGHHDGVDHGVALTAGAVHGDKGGVDHGKGGDHGNNYSSKAH